MTVPKMEKPPEPLVATFAERASPGTRGPPSAVAPRSFGVDFAKLKIFSDSPPGQKKLDERPEPERGTEQPAEAAKAEAAKAGDAAPHVAEHKRGRKVSNKRPPPR